MLENRLSPLTSLPALDGAALPPEIRQGTPEDRKLYQAALGFERMLVEQITANMTEAASLLSDEEDGEDEGGSALGFLGDQLPDTLASAVTAGGGLGLAMEIYRGVKRFEDTDVRTEEDAP